MYATPDDMRASYGEDVLVQLTGEAAWGPGAIAKITVKLVDASVLADGFVGKYYAAGNGAAPPLLKRLVREIAFAELWSNPTESVEKRKSDALAILDKISKGTVKIDEGRADLPAREGAVIVPERERTFSRDTLRGF